MDNSFESDLERIVNGFESSNFLSFKYKNYFDVYVDIFSKYVNKKITFIEIGVANGGSLFMWRKFFGPEARIIGIDLEPKAVELEKYGFEIFIGDQKDNDLWKMIKEKVGMVDIILDDGGHTDEQQILAVKNCIPIIKDGGLLVVEDVHCSYERQNGNPSRFSFVSFCKRIVDSTNSRFEKSFNIGLKDTSYRESIFSTAFYESIVAFNINRELCRFNYPLKNLGQTIGGSDKRHMGTPINKLIIFREFIIKNLVWYKKHKKFFKFLNAFLLNSVISIFSKFNKFKLLKYFR